jgi:hypothetical protein
MVNTKIDRIALSKDSGFATLAWVLKSKIFGKVKAD